MSDELKSLVATDDDLSSLRTDLEYDFRERAAVANPLDKIEYDQSLESDVPKEMSALLKAFKDKAKNEQRRYTEATDSEYWFAVCFQTREQKEAFLRAMDWLKSGDKYLDGVAIAKQMKLPLPETDVRFRGQRRDKKMAELPVIE